MDSAKNSDKNMLNMMQTIYKTEHYGTLIEMIKRIAKGDDYEFEVSVNRKEGINISQYMDIVKYIATHAQTHSDNKLLRETTLDISYAYNPNNNNNYRITIVDENRINLIMSNLTIRKNHSIFSILTNNINNQSSVEEQKKMYIIHKIKDRKDIIDLNEFDIRIRLSRETNIDKQTINELVNLSEGERNKIMFRFKERLSYVIIGNENFDIRIDLTHIKQNMSLLHLNNSPSIYELELEIIKKSNKGFNEESAKYIYNKLLLEIYRLNQLLQKSTKIITTSAKKNVSSTINKLLYGKPDYDAKDLPGMPSVSLENQHVTSDLTSNYSITDKADGLRNFLLISNGKIFLISENLNIKEIDNSLYQKLETYDNTILDGEYVFLEEQNKFIYLAFDVLIFRGKDLRNEVKLESRIEKLNEIMKDSFNVKSVTEKYNGVGDLQKIIYFYKNQIVNLFEEINSKLKKQTTVITCKTFFIPLGLYPSEVYAYSEMVWSLYTMDKTINCPYKLDGVIYTPLNQKYTRVQKEIRYPIYKWKPPSMNSIDFFVRFEKNPENQQILNVYDNSFDKSDLSLEDNTVDEASSVLEDMTQYKATNKVYRICNLHVGSIKTGKEEPVLFQKDQALYKAYLYLQDGEVRDIEGNIIQDNTVVEFSYKNDQTNDHPYNWIPLRTRYDKTESVVKYQRKYGNNEYIADKIWRSILVPFEFNDIKMLADEKTFDNHFKNVITPRVTKEIIVMERAEKKYYEVNSKLGTHMRAFHNFIKSNLIYTYCGTKLVNGEYRKLDVIDIGAGIGGDLMKHYHARVNKLFVFDPDSENVYSSTDGIYSRYITHKRKFPNFPETTIFIASGSGLFNLESQEKIIGNMSDANKQTIKKVFGENAESTRHETFDVFSCQFMLHYLFATDLSLKNLCDNVNKFLRKDGYILITMPDGDLLHKSFVDDKITHYYTDSGNKKILFEYKKLYTSEDLNKTGLAIDFFNASFMAEGTYQTEYIVTPNFLIDTLGTNCNMHLVETDTFENQFNSQKHFIDIGSQFESNLKTRDQFNKIRQFYNMELDDNLSSFELSRLNRYYVFQKMK